MQALKLVVVGLGVLIVISIGLLGWGFYSKLKRSEGAGDATPAQVAPPLADSGSAPGQAMPPAAFGEVRVALPPGCTAVEMQPHAGKLYVRIGPAGPCERILVIDGTSGRLLGSIVLAP
jgi:hypothetical protein